MATIISNGFRKAKKIQNNRLERLNLLLLGGTVMLIVDHIWNGEILLAGKNIFKDLLLGLAMTGAIFIVWGLMILKNKKQLAQRS